MIYHHYSIIIIFNYRKGDYSEELKSKFNQSWENEKRRPKYFYIILYRPSLIKALWSAFKKDYIVAGFLKVVHDIFQFVVPIVLNYLILFMDDSTKTIGYGITLAIVLFASSIIQSICLRQYFFICYRVGMQLRSSVITSVYDKSLRLNSYARSQYTSGQINNLMSVDGMKLQNLTGYLQTIWSGPFQIIISITLLWFQLGWACLGGIFVIIIMIPMSTYIAKALERYQILVMKTKDERIKFLGELLNGIKIVKLQTWEESFIDSISSRRKTEIGYLFKYYLYYIKTSYINKFIRCYMGFNRCISWCCFIWYIYYSWI